MAHKLETTIHRAEFTKEVYEIYRKFQMNIHHEPEEKVTEKGFIEFLVQSPLIYEPVPEGLQGPEQGYGSFHVHYRLDGKLIAVSVVDFLPESINSVYFMWDTDYKHLALGIYSALKDIQYMKENPPWKYYFLGWYIHTCPKMNYKSSFKGCQLQCPVTFNYLPFNQEIRNLLDIHGYTQLDFKNPLYVDTDTESALLNIPLLIRNTLLLSGSLENGERIKSLLEQLLIYVGSDMVQKMVVVFNT